jgi:hypothetical protein
MVTHMNLTDCNQDPNSLSEKTGTPGKLPDVLPRIDDLLKSARAEVVRARRILDLLNGIDAPRR